MSVQVKKSRIERMLDAFTYVSRTAIRNDDPNDRYLKVIKEGLEEERAEGIAWGAREARIAMMAEHAADLDGAYRDGVEDGRNSK